MRGQDDKPKVTGEHKTAKQCKTCPWRVGSDPEKDIPNYSRELHQRLTASIRSGVASLGPGLGMACHYSPTGNEIHCAGWLHNQAGSGNNLGVRVGILYGKLPVPIVDGEQHECFEDTIPGHRTRPR